MLLNIVVLYLAAVAFGKTHTVILHITVSTKLLVLKLTIAALIQF